MTTATVPHPFLSPAWTDTLCLAINASDDYRTAGADWTFGPVEMAIVDGTTTRYLVLDVHAGACRGIVVRDEPSADPAMRLTAERSVWRELLEQRGNPAVEIAKKRIRFDGDWLQLIRHQDAARLLINLAADVDTAW